MPKVALQTQPKRPCALLWDESFLWGLIARRTLSEAQLPFDLVRSREIREGILSRYAMLFVPGGWAAAKIQTLGTQGYKQIHQFVESGGGYLGLCGGAGLALTDGLHLTSVDRKPSSERLPSFSGPIRLSFAEHNLWGGLTDNIFNAWWPLQFQIDKRHDVRILAVFDEAQPEAMSADIRIGNGRTCDWERQEERYGIRLNPKHLQGEPAVLESRLGKGKVILSLVHFDTPNDQNGTLVLKNIWRYLTGKDTNPQNRSGISPDYKCPLRNDPEILSLLHDCREAVNDLLATGQSLRLWSWRRDWLLQWQRGVRGMEYTTLILMIHEIVSQLYSTPPTGAAGPKLAACPPSIERSSLQKDLSHIRKRLLPFVKEAKNLLFLETSLPPTDRVSVPESPTEAIRNARLSLFGSSRHYGGKFKELLDITDQLLFKCIR